MTTAIWVVVACTSIIAILAAVLVVCVLVVVRHQGRVLKHTEDVNLRLLRRFTAIADIQAEAYVHSIETKDPNEERRIEEAEVEQERVFLK